MDKNYRIKTNISNDTILNVNMKQDYDFLEVLTMKLRQKDAYRLHSSNYGVVIGRVLANDAFGIPNAKVSLFIERDDNDNETIESIYPYKEVMSKDDEGRRYNLLPDDSDDDCYRVVGTFPNKRLVLDNDSQLEIYDRYWKYTTVTNNAGDYMLFGIPSGSQQIHVDIDLSDIGVLSQKPRDFLYKGYNLSMFDSTSQFKESTNLDSLAQLFSQNKSTFVYPFWGDADNGIAAITRCDVQIQYKFEPTCVFMGAIISDNNGNAIGPKCAPEVDNGMNNQLVAGEGTIEMIRKTTDGLVEEFQIQGNQLIDSDGVWCYQIPMNLDFVGTDEYGNIVPTDNPNKGIPTRTQVRFRFSKIETGDEGFSRHTAKYLVPMNPIFDPNKTRPTVNMSGEEFEKFYTFGSATPDSCFRDLYWNNVYSVKNYIPKVQVAHRSYSKNYGALKGSNLVDNQNSVPFNHLRIDMPFMYVIVCIIFDLLIIIVTLINGTVIWLINLIISILNSILNICLPLGIGCIFSWAEIPYIGCISLGGNLSDKNVAFYPGCDSRGQEAARCPDGMENCSKSANNDVLRDLVQQRLAEDYKIVKLDFYQDWMNGVLYMPLWYWMKRKKKTFLFGLFSKSARNDYCSCDRTYSRLKTYVNCNIEYNDESFGVDSNRLDLDEESWHRDSGRAEQVRYQRGLIKSVTNKDGLNVYYYVAMQATTENDNEMIPMSERPSGFKAALLYATDIILLGNLNAENIYGIPQFFKALPSTTANIPPIAAIEEQSTDTNSSYEGSEVSSAEDAGPSVTTGMDWEHDGDEDSPNYKKGLFMDLQCTNAKTRSKSCINVERLSELGVNLDTAHIMQYPSNSVLNNDGFMDTDGFITKYELDDMENRAMFATMNHIGFIPQTYQDSIGGYTTQVEDERTHYLVPKFKYLYPVDFDGRMRPIMDAYKNGFQQSTYDVRDQAYITFRMGAEANKGEIGRIRHFYYNYSMPVYNNSFYFYFGVNKGKTAIDKFNKLFYAECVKYNKEPFTLNVESRGTSYCPNAYTNIENGYGYIKLVSDDIQIPYSYVLYDSLGILVSSKDDLSSKEFTIKDVETTSTVEADKKLKNQVYTLIVTDGNGKSVRERVSLDMNTLSFDYDVRKLGTKFYNIDMTPPSFICNADNDYFGVIKISKVYIDGYSFDIITVDKALVSGEELTLSATCSCNTQGLFRGNVIVYFKVSPIKEDGVACLCEEGISTNGFSFVDNTIELYVYRPMSYTIVMTQECNGQEIEGNKTSQLIKVDNGSNFNTFLNGMPIRFMLGSISDTQEATVANNSNFYRSNASSQVINGENHLNGDLLGWFGVHQETSYKFNETTTANSKVWTDYLSFGNSITDIKAKSKILKYKFDKIFKLSNVVYNTSSSNQSFTYTYDGGIEPILNRSLAPYYSDTKKMVSVNVYSDNNSVSMNRKNPNIVGTNYIGDSDTTRYDNGTTPRFNGLWNSNSTETYLGNYFAAFTKNGRYTSQTTGNCSTNIMAIPNYAPVNVVDGWKKLGKEIQIDEFPQGVRSSGNYDTSCRNIKTQPYLRALTVDRRLDYDLEIWSPTNRDNFNIHDDEKLERIRKSSRIRGTIYGGIEMSFDANDNIISANTEYDDLGNTLRFINNKRLEYSYSANSGNSSNAVTIYNEPDPENVVWVSRGDYVSQNLNSFLTNAVNALADCGMPSSEELKRRVDETYDNINLEALITAYFNEEVDKVLQEFTGMTEEEAIEYVNNDSELMEGIEISAETSATTLAITSALSEDEINKIHQNYYKVVDELGKISGDTVDLQGHGIINFIIKLYGDADQYLTNYFYGLEELLNNIETYMPKGEDCTVYATTCPQNTSGDILSITASITQVNWEDKQYLKTLREADVNGTDISELLWSDFNKKLLNDYCTSPFNNISGNTDAVYVYSGISEDNYNGDFNSGVINSNPSKNYPTKRYIDIGNLPESTYYELSLTSFGYGMNPQLNTDGSIMATATNGDNAEIEVAFTEPFEFKDMFYVHEEPQVKMFMVEDEDEYKKFERNSVRLYFKFKNNITDGKVQTSMPQPINVLKADGDFNGTDGITYLKTASNYIYGNESDFYKRLEEVNIGEFDWSHPNEDNIERLPKNVDELKIKTYFHNKTNGEPIYNDSEEFGKFYFMSWRYSPDCVKAGVDLSNSLIFAIILDRKISGSDKTLTNKIISHEIISLFDVRKILVKMSGTSTTEYNYDFTFTFKNKASYYEQILRNRATSETITLYFTSLEAIEESKERYEREYEYIGVPYKILIDQKDCTNQTVAYPNFSNIRFIFGDKEHPRPEQHKHYFVDGEDIIDESEPHGDYMPVRKVRAVFTTEYEITGVRIFSEMNSGFTHGLYDKEGEIFIKINKSETGEYYI